MVEKHSVESDLVHRNRVRPDRSVMHTPECRLSKAPIDPQTDFECRAAFLRVSEVDVSMKPFDRVCLRVRNQTALRYPGCPQRVPAGSIGVDRLQ